MNNIIKINDNNKNKEIETDDKKQSNYKNLISNIKIEETPKKKPLLSKSNSTNNKNISIDLNDNAIKRLFNIIFHSIF